MKLNKKLKICAFTAALSIMSAVPVAVYADNSAHSEWFTDENGRIFYYDTDGNYLTGVQEIDGEKYLFSANGVLKTGWRTIDGQRFYFDPETGKPMSGWLEYCGKKYYVDADNGKITGYFKENDGDAYILSEKGSAVTEEGFTEVGEDTYYVNSDGKAETGKVVTDDNTYFFADDGKMSFGWQTIDDNRYYFDNDGIMLTGWQVIDGYTYYFSDDGTTSAGITTIDGDTYCFYADGVMVTGWVEEGEYKYYCGSDGKMLYGWQTIDGDEYFFNDYGIMETNTTIDGKTLGADGKVPKLSAVQVKANTVISQIGTSTEAIYNFVRNNNKYSFIETTKTQAQIEAIGWSYFANYAFNNRFVVCYYFAAITDLLYKQAGYESRIVHGTGTGTGDHYWNEVKLNGTWYCIDTCNGFFQVSFSYLQGKNYTFYNYVYPTYN
ncbi:MAG: hypothetical protein K2G14_01385, partial [Ruminococcus sp.]|nr:hypothetical protein [Ruminococcus sp.]